MLPLLIMFVENAVMLWLWYTATAISFELIMFVIVYFVIGSCFYIYVALFSQQSSNILALFENYLVFRPIEIGPDDF